MDYRNCILDRKAIQLENGGLIPEVNFDNASTTPVFNAVMNKINDFIHIYCCIDGGQSQREKNAMHLFEEARTSILNFVKGDKNKDVVIFLKNATEAINKFSYRLLDPERKDVILTTEMEHYSNILP